MPAEPGLFRLQDELDRDVVERVPISWPIPGGRRSRSKNIGVGLGAVRRLRPAVRIGEQAGYHCRRPIAVEPAKWEGDPRLDLQEGL